MQKAAWTFSVSVLLAPMACAQPALSFSRSEAAGGGSQANSFVVTDFNGDLKADVAFASGTGTFIMPGRGDGTFQAARRLDTGPVSFAILAADFNGDGRIDLVMTNSINANTITVVLGRGDGAFGPPQQFPAGTMPMGLVVADFNGDGKPDVAVANIAGLVPGVAGMTVSVMLGKGDGTFGPPLQSRVLGERPFMLAASDFNQDGKIDLAVVNSATPDVTLLFGNGDGTFRLPVALAPPSGILGAADVVVSDFNLDGRSDIAVLAS